MPSERKHGPCLIHCFFGEADVLSGLIASDISLGECFTIVNRRYHCLHCSSPPTVSLSPLSLNALSLPHRSRRKLKRISSSHRRWELFKWLLSLLVLCRFSRCNENRKKTKENFFHFCVFFFLLFFFCFFYRMRPNANNQRSH